MITTNTTGSTRTKWIPVVRKTLKRKCTSQDLVISSILMQHNRMTIGFKVYLLPISDHVLWDSVVPALHLSWYFQKMYKIR